MKKCHTLLLLLPGLAFFASSLQAEVKLPKVFTPHMVLQRGMTVPIWGTAIAGEKVTVKFRDQTKTAEAGRDGKWSIKLDALTAGGPDVLEVNGLKIDDVLVGEVWVGSGQSNMAMPVSSYIAGDPVLAAAAMESHPKIRLMKKQSDAAWQEATPETIKAFSALLFSFGVTLQKELDVPVGLMVGAVGGTPSGFWLSEAMYRDDAVCAELVKKFAVTYNYDAEKARYDVLKAKFDEDFAKWKPLADQAKLEGRKAPPGPRAPQGVGKPGEAVGGNVGQLFESFIRPYVGYGIKGVLWDQGESRTAIVGVPQYELMGALIRGWRKAWGQGDFPFLYVQKPSGGGCAWDYSDPVTSKAEPFHPQPPVIPPTPAPDYSHAYFATFMKYPGTYMVASSDLGSGVHPINKSAYGTRAALVAQSVAYGGTAEYIGPLFDSHEIKGDKITLKFTHTGKGLAFRNGEKLQGFQIAGDDKRFVWGDAVIEGDAVVLSSDEVPEPVAARYAWSPHFSWANLFNKDGLPAQPFRTDDW